MFQTAQLPNGLRIILAPSVTEVVYAGVAVATGTRHELDSESGMAHLVEHMTFKGTSRLSSTQILSRMESVGADLNAYTGKEETVYYSSFLRQHLRRALPLLMDIVFNSTYPQTELEKEVEVVIDEIESYNDSPAELIYDDFEALLFPEHPLGRSILGKADRLRQYKSEDLLRFARRCYSPERAVLFVKGNVSMKEVRKALSLNCPSALLMKEGVECMGQKDIPISPKETDTSFVGKVGGESIIPKNVHQAHVMLGARAYSAMDARYYGLALLNNLLGGPAMNSRLSLSLRERAGLVYTVESNLTAYTDTGVWSVYFGCDAADVRRCLRRVHRQLRRLIDAPLSPTALAAAKRQFIGQIGIGYDHFENVALGMGKRYLLYNQALTPEDIYAAINALTANQLQSIAADIFNPDHLTTLIYQPV